MIPNHSAAVLNKKKLNVGMLVGDPTVDAVMVNMEMIRCHAVNADSLQHVTYLQEFHTLKLHF